MPRGIPNAKPVAELPADAGVYDAYAPRNPNPPPAPQTDTVTLERHYRPAGNYEIVGYLKKAVERKNAAGRVEVIEPEEFIKGEMAPPPFPGVGYANKIWAGTKITLPLDEAKTLVRSGGAKRDWLD